MKKYSQTVINKHLNEAEKIALKIIEQKARNVLNRKPVLSEFVMGMGSWFFIFKGGEIADQSYDEFKGINQIIEKYDHILHLTGTPMRFTAKGKIIRDW